MIESIIPYVGLQLVKTGQSATHINIAHALPSFWLAFQRSLLEPSESQSFVVIFFQRLGKIVIIQKNIIMTPENFVSVFVSIPESTVVACNNIVKIMIDTESEAIIIYGLDLSLLSPALAPSITGSKGSTHGARIVRIPAKNDTMSNVIIINIF